MTPNIPLAVRMRPMTIDDLVGQDHLVAPGSPLRRLLEDARPTSVILYGPPGSGKTSIANVLSEAAGDAHHYVELNATSAGIADVRKAVDAAQKRADDPDDDSTTILFIDEIHRFSKSQQDVLLKPVENRVVTLIGATTENPSFSVISPLLSRSIMMVLRPLADDDIAQLLTKAAADPRGLNGVVTIEANALNDLVRLSGGDVRRGMTYLEECADMALAAGQTTITSDDVDKVAPGLVARYDKDGDQHYDIVSAWIKSMRGSDPDAALHWMARMIEAGEDPRFIARRLVVHASEDVGMAAPWVLPVAVAAAQAVQLIGMPEARINLAQACVAIATAPKSNACYAAIDAALADVKAGRTGEVPNHLRDSHYPGAAALRHGAGYLYPHDYEGHVVAQDYDPVGTALPTYYRPTRMGEEADVVKRLLTNEIAKVENA